MRVKAAFSVLCLALVIGCASPIAHDGNVLLRWTAPGAEGDIGTASVYDLRYHTEPLTVANWFDAPVRLADAPAPMIAGTVQEYTVTGLTIGQRYYFGIRTANDQGEWSGLSNIVFAYGQPPSDITTLEVVP